MNIPTRLSGATAATVLGAGLVLAPLAHASTEDDLKARVTAARSTAGCAPLTWANEGATVAWYSSWINADYTIAKDNYSELFAPIPPIDLHVNPQTDPIGALANVNATADRAVVIDQSGSRDRYAVDMLMGKAAAAIADCGYDTFGVGNFRNDEADVSSVAVALYTAHKDAPPAAADDGGGGVVIDPLVVTDKTVKVVPGPADELAKHTVTYSLKAQGLPLASVNISYLGNDDQAINDNNVIVGTGFTWNKTVTGKDTPWLKVSANSAGPVGLKLNCSVTVKATIERPNDPDPNRSGTISFGPGITPVAEQTCG